MSSRREFLKQAAAGAAAFSLTGLTKAGAEPAKPRVIGVDDEVRIGIAGVNSRGKAIATNVCKMPKVKITCICDCDSIALQNCREAV